METLPEQPAASPSPINPSIHQSTNPTLSFEIPAADLADFSRLPDKVRSAIRQKLGALATIHAAPSILPACKAQATRLQHHRGFSANRLRTQYYEYTKSGDWRVLIDRSSAGKDFTDRQEVALPGEFIEFWRGLCERFQRKSRPARRELLLIWRTHQGSDHKPHKTIPGYVSSSSSSSSSSSIPCPSGWPVADPKTGIPLGWSEANLYRYAPTRFELTAARISRAAAAEFRPQVLTTRVGLRVGQYLVFDDQEYDVKINFPGNSRAMRPLGLNSLDLFSACLFAYSFKPAIWNAEAEAKQKLKEVDMLWFTVHVLTSYGYRDDDAGTTLNVEHGTAAIREDFEQRIFDATHGKVRVERSGITRANSFDGLFEGQARGNFRFKAALESIFNLVRNEMAMLPGQTGLDRLHCPDDTAGRDRYNNSMLRAALALPPERAQLLRLPFLDWQQFTGLCLDIYQRINTRTDHDLEGWIRAGLTINEWRLPLSSSSSSSIPLLPGAEYTPWMPQSQFLALPAPEQSVMRQLIEATPSLSRARRLSPLEVFRRGESELAKVPTFLLPVLLGPEFGIERRARNGLFEWQDQAISPDPIRFLARGKDGQLPDGEKYLTYLNPFNPTELILCNAKGAYLETVYPWASPCRSDVEAVHRQMGQARKIEAELLAPVARRGAELAREKLEMHRHNADVLGSSSSLSSIPSSRLRSVDGDVSEFLEAPAAAPSAAPSDDDDSAESLL